MKEWPSEWIKEWVGESVVMRVVWWWNKWWGQWVSKSMCKRTSELFLSGRISEWVRGEELSDWVSR